MIFYLKTMIGLHSVAYFMHCVGDLDILMEQRLKTYHISAAILNVTYLSSLMLYEDSWYPVLKWPVGLNIITCKYLLCECVTADNVQLKLNV